MIVLCFFCVFFFSYTFLLFTIALFSLFVCDGRRGGGGVEAGGGVQEGCFYIRCSTIVSSCFTFSVAYFLCVSIEHLFIIIYILYLFIFHIRIPYLALRNVCTIMRNVWMSISYLISFVL